MRFWSSPWTWVVGFILLIGLCSIGSWEANILLFQPMNRQTINHDANRQIQVNNHFHQLAADHDTACSQLALDKQQLSSFESGFADKTKMSFQDKEQDSQLRANVAGDQQAVTSATNQYNQDMSSPDWVGADNSVARSLQPCNS